MSEPANVLEFREALSVLQTRIASEQDPEALRLLLEHQERLLLKMNELPFAQLGLRASRA